MKKLLKEPLFHFFLIGGILFFISAIVNRKAAVHTNEASEIVVTDSLVLQLVEKHKLHFSNTGKIDTNALIQQYITTEMLYREAVKIGLDKNNDSVKALLAAQMSIAYEPNNLPSPSEEDLKRLLQDTSWYKNETNFADTSEAFFSTMKMRLRSRYNTLEKQKQVAEKLKMLEKSYRIIRNDHH